MADEPEKETADSGGCPLCTLWAAYKHSEAAKHVRGIEREGLMLARSLLNVCIRAAEKRFGKARTGADDR